jgi:hypothetical protein
MQREEHAIAEHGLYETTDGAPSVALEGPSADAVYAT